MRARGYAKHQAARSERRFFCSTSTLEHIPAPDIALILRECRRVATANAVFSFAIDYHDHYASGDPGITRFNFYRYGDAAWRVCNPAMHFQNRLRHSDYERLFAEQGMVATLNRRIIPADSPDDFAGLAPPFRGYVRDDLAALNGVFVLAARRHEAPVARQPWLIFSAAAAASGKCTRLANVARMPRGSVPGTCARS